MGVVQHDFQLGELKEHHYLHGHQCVVIGAHINNVIVELDQRGWVSVWLVLLRDCFIFIITPIPLMSLT